MASENCRNCKGGIPWLKLCVCVCSVNVVLFVSDGRIARMASIGVLCKIIASVVVV